MSSYAYLFSFVHENGLVIEGRKTGKNEVKTKAGGFLSLRDVISQGKDMFYMFSGITRRGRVSVFADTMVMKELWLCNMFCLH